MIPIQREASQKKGGIEMINTVTETPLESEGNPYWTWIKNYAEDSFQDAVKAGKGKAI